MPSTDEKATGTNEALVAEGGLGAAPTAVEGDKAAGRTDAMQGEAMTGRDNGNNPEEASSMTPQDWASLARP